MRACLAALAALTFIATTPALAAEDGVLGATSSGTIGVSGRIEAPVAGQVRVSGLDDIDLGAIQPGRGLGDRFCLYHTSPSFSLTVDQIGGGGFRLIGPTGVEIPYLVEVLLFPGGARLEPGTPATGLVANTVSETCADGQTSLISALPDSTQFPDTPPAGAYTATLSIVMAAE